MLNWGRSRLIQWTVERHRRSITRGLQAFPPFRPINYDKSIVNELIVITGVLAILFFLARSLGTLDARRDAVNNTSTLPVIGLVIPTNNLGFRRTLNDLTLDPSPKDFRVIGDLALYEHWLQQDLNDIADFNASIVWRLLGDRSVESRVLSV